MKIKNRLINFRDRYINLPAATKGKILLGAVIIGFIALLTTLYISFYRISLDPPFTPDSPLSTHIPTSIHKPSAPLATDSPPTAINESKSELRSQTGDLATEHTYVLLGNDFRSNSADRFENTQQSDAFIIIHVMQGKVTLISVARELIIHDYDGIEENVKVSQIYAHNGFEGVETFVEDIFGLSVDGVIATDLNRFPQIVDAIGGVNLTPSMSVFERCGDKDIFYKVNIEVVMDGEELLCYARGRLYSPVGYFDRQERHFEVLNALWQRVEERMYDDPLITSAILLSEFLPLVDTNMNDQDIFFLAIEFIVVFSEFENDFDVNLVSMDRSILELYGRIGEGDPFLYYPTTDLKEWTQDAIND